MVLCYDILGKLTQRPKSLGGRMTLSGCGKQALNRRQRETLPTSQPESGLSYFLCGVLSSTEDVEMTTCLG